MMKNDVKSYGTWVGHVNNEKAGGSMVRVVIYGEHKEETEGLEGMLRAILTEKQRWPVIHTYIGNLESYLHFVRGNPYLIMLVSVMGKKGAQTVRRIRENNPAASLIWLSDEGNALEFWKLHANAFGLFPPRREKLEEFLTDCLSRTERQGRIGKLQEEHYEKTI